MIIFTTFTSTGYEAARDRILKEVQASGVFDMSYTYNEHQLTPELLASPTFQIKKGLGHYSWKPDIIWQTFNLVNEGDIVVYLDAGCSVNNSTEWQKYMAYLDSYDILAFRIHQRNYKWTRESVFIQFSQLIKNNWRDNYQFGANAIMFKKTPQSLSFVSEWRDYMIKRLDLCGDVSPNEISKEDSRFIENRYDQTIMTALLYEYYQKGGVKAIWEHYEGEDILKTQAFKASRKRNSASVDNTGKMYSRLKCFIKQYLYYPLVGNFIWGKCLKQANR